MQPASALRAPAADAAARAALAALPLPARRAADLIWGYMHVGHSLPAAPADAILALGSNDPRVAERAAALYLEGRAPRLVLTGGVGALTRGLYKGDSEAEAFAKIAEAMGVPRAAMLLEPASTNTGENFRFSAAAMGAPAPGALILVQKPFMERRTLATFLKQWPVRPLPRVHVTSPQISFEDYVRSDAPGLSVEEIICTMMGDLQRIAIYPAMGFQAYQAIPQEVWDALKLLVREGFTRSEQLILVAGAQRGSTRVEDYEGLAPAAPPAEAP